MKRSLRIFSGLGSAEVVFEADYVVFSKVIASLDFDENEIFVAGILDSVRGSNRNIDRFAVPNGDFAAVERHLGSSFHDEPVLGALRVFLVTQSLSGQHFDALDLERTSFFEHCVTAPWSPIEFSQSVGPPLKE
jgi:hypothetical protein